MPVADPPKVSIIPNAPRRDMVRGCPLAMRFGLGNATRAGEGAGLR